MATACIRVQAPEKLADNVAPVGFTPLHDMGRGNYAISGSGIALPAPAAGRLIVVTTAALVQPFSSVSAIGLTKTWATAKSGVVIEVSIDGCQWRPIEPKYAMVPCLQAVSGLLRLRITLPCMPCLHFDIRSRSCHGP